jgi:RNA 2',3'-cyclic 3'-phosphodiesterase
LSMRLFYAIEFPDPVKASLKTISLAISPFSRQGRWSRPENLHLTLQFLGECPEEWLPALAEILHQATHQCRPFSMSISGCGTFGRHQDVFWLGVGPSLALTKLADGLRDLLKKQNLPFEDLPFAPHITLARQVQMDKGLIENFHYPDVTFSVLQVSLMESIRAEGRLVYKRLAVVHLESGTE